MFAAFQTVLKAAPFSTLMSMHLTNGSWWEHLHAYFKQGCSSAGYAQNSDTFYNFKSGTFYYVHEGLLLPYIIAFSEVKPRTVSSFCPVILSSTSYQLNSNLSKHSKTGHLTVCLACLTLCVGSLIYDTMGALETQFVHVCGLTNVNIRILFFQSPHPVST